MDLFKTKTPENEKRSERIVTLFEVWFLAIPDVDKTLLDKDVHGNYIDGGTNYALAAFLGGLASANDCLFTVHI